MDVLRGLLAGWVVLHHIVGKRASTDCVSVAIARASRARIGAGFLYPQRLCNHEVTSRSAATLVVVSDLARSLAHLSGLFAALAMGAGVYGGMRTIGAARAIRRSEPPGDRSLGAGGGFAPVAHTLLHLFQLHGVVRVVAFLRMWIPAWCTAWSLSTEFQFYVIAPLLCLVLLHRSGNNQACARDGHDHGGDLAELIDAQAISPANVLRYIDLLVLGMIGAIVAGSGLSWQARL